MLPRPWFSMTSYLVLSFPILVLRSPIRMTTSLQAFLQDRLESAKELFLFLLFTVFSGCISLDDIHVYYLVLGTEGGYDNSQSMGFPISDLLVGDSISEYLVNCLLHVPDITASFPMPIFSFRTVFFWFCPSQIPQFSSFL